MSGERLLKFVVHPFASEVVTSDEPRFLSVGWQGDDLVVWAEATVGEGCRTELVAVPTGGFRPLAAEYIGTAQHPTLNDGGPLVMHVYRRAPR